MKKTVVILTSMFALLFSACSQIPGFSPTPATGQTVDTAGTADAQFKTAVVQTLTAQPTLSPVPVIDTATALIASPALESTSTLSPDLLATSTLPSLNLTTTPVTATGGPVNSTATATLGAVQLTSTASLVPGQATPTWTPGVRTYGTLPPAVPSNRITVINKAKAQAYISLHVDMSVGNTVIEYPVEGMVRIDAPIGPYLYVAWVGGRKMTGSFKLTSSDDITITLYKDHVVIK